MVAAESDLKGLREITARHGSRMPPHIVDVINRPWTAEELTSANVVRKAVANKMWRFMRNYDLLLTPTLAVPPFALHIQGVAKIEGRMVAPFQWLAFTFPMNLTGNPAASVPAGSRRPRAARCAQGAAEPMTPAGRSRVRVAAARPPRGGRQTIDRPAARLPI